jgi:hypothetical protein
MEMNSDESINISRSQGGTGDHASERRLGKTRKSMDKDPIQARPGWVSWHKQATNRSAAVHQMSFDFARQVNGATVRGRTALLPREACPMRARQESAEVIGVGKMSWGLEMLTFKHSSAAAESMGWQKLKQMSGWSAFSI